MKRLIIILLFITSFVKTVKCEIWPAYNIFDLCLMSDEIVEAKFIEERGRDYIFLTRPFDSKREFRDTFVFQSFHSVIRVNPEILFPSPLPSLSGEKRMEESIKGYLDIEDLQTGSTFILFLKNHFGNILHPLIGGYRVINEDLVYIPNRGMNYGDYVFTKSELAPKKLFREIRRAKKRADSFKSILNSKNEFLQRVRYRSWLRKNRDIIHNKNQHSTLGMGVLGNFYYRKLNSEGVKPEDVDLLEVQKYLRERD